MIQLTRGFRCKLEDQLNIQLPFEVSLKTEGNAVYDTCCFGVNQDDQLANDRFMIFYNQPASPGNAICLHDDSNYTINLSALPSDIAKLIFTVSIDGCQTMGEITEHVVQVSQNGNLLMELRLTGKDFTEERAIIGIEIYHKTVWRISAVAKGFNGGLEALLEFYGGESISPEDSDDEYWNDEETSDEDSAKADFSKTDFSKAEKSDSVSLIKTDKDNNPVLGKKPVSLQKGQKVFLKKEDGDILREVMVGLGWDMAVRGKSIDCDSSVFLCKNGKLSLGNEDVVCYTHLSHKSGAVKHMGDNLTGAGSGDDERIFVSLDRLPPQYDRIVFVVNIFLAKITRQHFGMVKNCFIRICDGKGKEMCRFNLSENYNRKTAMIFGELKKENGLWSFHASGEGTKDGSISALKRRFQLGMR